MMNPHHCAPFLISHPNVNAEMRYQSVSGLSVLWKSSAGIYSESELFLLCSWPDSPVLPHSTADLR